MRYWVIRWPSLPPPPDSEPDRLLRISARLFSPPTSLKVKSCGLPRDIPILFYRSFVKDELNLCMVCHTCTKVVNCSLRKLCNFVKFLKSKKNILFFCSHSFLAFEKHWRKTCFEVVSRGNGKRVKLLPSDLPRRYLAVASGYSSLSA